MLCLACILITHSHPVAIPSNKTINENWDQDSKCAITLVNEKFAIDRISRYRSDFQRVFPAAIMK